VQGCNDISEVLFCEDFESNGINSNKWNTSVQNGGRGSVSGAKAKDGSKSLNIVTQNVNGSHFFLEPKNVFPITGNHYFGRAYLYIDGQLPQGHNLVLSTSSLVDGNIAAHRLDANKNSFNSRYTHKSISHIHGGLRIPTNGSQDYKFPADQWVCIEWELNGSQNSMRYWFNSVFASALEIKGNESPIWRAGQFSGLKLGWQAYQAQNMSYSFYWDSIVLAKQRIGCLSP
jgi:hypothetical protein